MTKKVLYTEIDEDITSIFDRIKRLKQKKITLIVPKKSVLLQSLINLKILAKKIRELGKEIEIITTDRSGKHLSEKAGIITKSKLHIDKPPTKSATEALKEYAIKPVRALTNRIQKDHPHRSNAKKIRITDIIHDFKRRSGASHEQENSNEMWSDISLIRNVNKKSIFLVFLVSIGIFITVIYIAIPGATIYIKPKSEILEQPVNIILADKQTNDAELARKNTHMIPYYTFKKDFEKNIIFQTLNQEFTGENSVGEITIINGSEQEWPLRNKTQFQTPSGIIFRIQRSVTISEKNGDKFGSITVPAIADPFDIYGNIVGERGNIEPSKFVVRKLSPSQQKQIWGESKTKMKGGITKYRKIVTEADIETAKKKIELELINSAKEYMANHINEWNKINNSSLRLLNNENFLEKEILEIKYSPDIIGQELEKFEIYAKMRVEGIAFNYNQFRELLRNQLVTRLHPDMRLNEKSINDSTIRYSIIDENKQKHQLTLSASIQGVQEYIIEPTSESGLRFTKKVKEKTMGKTKEEAIAYISNLPEVADVEINVWSLWSSLLPTVPENITIKYKGN